jgi:hypothetical protein
VVLLIWAREGWITYASPDGGLLLNPRSCPVSPKLVRSILAAVAVLALALVAAGRLLTRATSPFSLPFVVRRATEARWLTVAVLPGEADAAGAQ